MSDGRTPVAGDVPERRRRPDPVAWSRLADLVATGIGAAVLLTFVAFFAWLALTDLSPATRGVGD